MCLDMGKGRECLRELSYRSDKGDRDMREGKGQGREKRKGKTRGEGCGKAGNLGTEWGIVHVCVNVGVCIYICTYVV